MTLDDDLQTVSKELVFLPGFHFMKVQVQSLNFIEVMLVNISVNISVKIIISLSRFC